MQEITIIGGINVDIEGVPYDKLLRADSNPGQITVKFGGVGRNIVENIARLDQKVSMISITGDDFQGTSAKEHLTKLGVDVSNIYTIENETTAMYLSILNSQNDMEVAICNMDILEKLTCDFFKDKIDNLKKSKIIGIDCNLNVPLLEYLTEELSSIPLFLDPVSASKSPRIKPLIGKFHTIKPNKMEAEIISDIKITDDESLHKAAHWFLKQGVKQVFITLGIDGMYYLSESEEGYVPSAAKNILSATGAGDSVSAAIVVGTIKKMSMKEIAEFSMAAASITMESMQTVSPDMSLKKINTLLQ